MKEEDKWLFSRTETDECISQPKVPVGPVPDWQPKSGDGRSTVQKKFKLRFKDRPTIGCTLRYSAHGAETEPRSYAAAFILNNQRIRGIDYTPVKNMHMFRETETREAGWHENIIYADAETSTLKNEHTAYAELQGFHPQSLEDLLAFTCSRWNIELPDEERRLL